MDKLVLQLIENELERADKKHGPTVFDFHHAYGIVKEEVEEADLCADNLNVYLSDIWKDIKFDAMSEEIIAEFDILESLANELLSEVVQVMAMCEKIKRELTK